MKRRVPSAEERGINVKICIKKSNDSYRLNLRPSASSADESPSSNPIVFIRVQSVFNPWLDSPFRGPQDGDDGRLETAGDVDLALGVDEDVDLAADAELGEVDAG